jgi:formamidopyrimidine-DNA glycosylase
MPELPEVETIVRGLQRFIPGKTIRTVEVRHKKIAARHGVKAFQRLLAGQTFAGVERRGKFLHFQFKSGDGLVVHLRMTGKFIVHPKGAVPYHKHLRLVLRLAGGSALLYSDLRIFGSFHAYRAGEEVIEFLCVGRDPVREKIDADWFLGECRRRSIPIKVLLLDQKVIGGIGNIYACEALFRARLSPLLPARKLTRCQAERLLQNIRSLLLLAIRHNGTSVSDFRDVDDRSGGFQRLLKVYGRAGEACPECGAAVKRVRQAQRSTFYCPRCQGAVPCGVS